MHRQRTSLLAFAVAALLVALVGVACVLLVAPVGAQAAPWRVGPTDPGRIVLWADGLAVAPVVQIVGGRGGLNPPEDDGAGTLRAVVWCEECEQIVIDGVRVWPLWRVALPLMMRTP